MRAFTLGMNEAPNEAQKLAVAMFSLPDLSPEEKHEHHNLADMLSAMAWMPADYQAAWLGQHSAHLADRAGVVAAILDKHDEGLAGRLRRFMGELLSVAIR